MSTKPSLSALMKRAAHSSSPVDQSEAPATVAVLVAPQPAPAPAAALPVALPPPQAPAAAEPAAKVAASRMVKKPLSVWVAPEARRTLRQLAAEQDRTIESMIAEGLNDLFQKYQKPRLA